MAEDQQRLSQIETRWSLVVAAHRAGGDATQAAQGELLERYRRAVHRYLLRVTRDPEAAADLGQEFALRFLRGDFRRADPRRGRFRDLVKTAILHLVIDAHRRARARPTTPLRPDDEPAAPGASLTDLEDEFFACWRHELMEHAWGALACHEAETGQPYYTVLRLRADHRELRSADLAERLGPRLGRPVNAGWVRQNLLRARERFAALLVEEVARSLGDPSPEEVDDELRNLDLWDYCRDTRGTE